MWWSLGSKGWSFPWANTTTPSTIQPRTNAEFDYSKSFLARGSFEVFFLSERYRQLYLWNQVRNEWCPWPSDVTRRCSSDFDNASQNSRAPGLTLRRRHLNSPASIIEIAKQYLAIKSRSRRKEKIPSDLKSRALAGAKPYPPSDAKPRVSHGSAAAAVLPTLEMVG